MKKSPETHLSPREKEIIRLISQGVRREEIAKKLTISKFTYDGHRKNIRNKLSIKNQADWVQVLHDISNQLKSPSQK